MAFNPFHSFRKHQRVILAAVTIMIMFIFVLSFGRGDAFERLANLFGISTHGRQDRSETVTTLYGKKVSEADLDHLRRQRLMVNNIVIQAVVDGHRGALKDIRAAVPRFQPQSRTSVDMILDTAQRAIEPPDLAKIPHADQQKLQQIFQEYQMNRMMFPSQIPGFLQRLEVVARDNPEEAATVRQLVTLLLQQRWLMERSQVELYFGGSTLTDELLDFLVWKQQADKLEIHLTDDAVRAEINSQSLSRDTLTGDLKKDSERIGQYLQRAGYGQNRATTVDEVYAALRDELRVSMAQSALLGSVPGALSGLERRLGTNEVPATVTPDQFYAYYRDNLTRFKVSMQPVPVKNFLDQVTGQPSEKELKALFKEFRDQEPSPDRDQPGFRQPRRVRFEWVHGRAESDHYKGLAAAGIASVISDPWTALGLVAQLNTEYGFLKDSHKLPAWTEPDFALPFYTSLNEAPNAAATWAKAFGTLASGGSPVAVAAAYQAGAVVRDHKEQAEAIAIEARDRAPLAAAFALATTQPGQFAPLMTVLALQQHGAQAPRTLPYLAIKKQVMDRLINQMANSLLSDNIGKIRKEATERKGKSDKNSDWAREAAKKYGLAYGHSTKALDQFQVDEDEAVKELRDAVKEGRGPKFRMAETLFGRDPSLYQPQFGFNRNTNDLFLYWKTEDTDAKTYSTYADAPADIKALVEQAWRFQQAREKARAATMQAEDEARKQKNADAAMRYLRDTGAKQKWGEAIELSNISRLVSKPVAREMFKNEYEAYQAPEDKLNARPSFVDDLLKSLHKPGDVTVVWNKPESMYYVVVLEDRQEPGEADFVKLYRKTPTGDSLLERLDQEKRQKFRQGVLEQLRTEAGKVSEHGLWVVDADVRRRIEGRSHTGDE